MVHGFDDGLKKSLTNSCKIMAEFIPDKEFNLLLNDVRNNVPKQEIMKQDYCKYIDDKLQFMRKLYPQKTEYIYLFIPINNNIMVVMESRTLHNESGKVNLQFGEIININNMPYLQKLINMKKSVTEVDYKYNPILEEDAMSSYAPIYNDDGKILGYVGMNLPYEFYHTIINIVTIKSLTSSMILFIFVAIFLPAYIYKLYEYRKNNKKLRETKKQLKQLKKRLK